MAERPPKKTAQGRSGSAAPERPGKRYTPKAAKAAPKGAPRPAPQAGAKGAPKAAPRPAPGAAAKPGSAGSAKPAAAGSAKPGAAGSPKPAGKAAPKPGPKAALKPGSRPAPRPGSAAAPGPRAAAPRPAPAPRSAPKPAPRPGLKAGPKPARSSPKPSLAKTTPEPTLDTLERRLGAPDADLRAAIFDGTDDATLIEIGTRVDSADILRDVPRFVAEASEIERSLSTAQRECLLFSPAILAVLVGEAQRLRGLARDPVLPADPAVKAEARAEVREGLAIRNNVSGALRNALGAAAMSRVEELVGAAETAGQLASGMDQLAMFIDELFKIGGRHEHVRLKAFHLTAGRARVLRDQAARLRALEAGRPGLPEASEDEAAAQRRLDLQDGRVIELVDRVLRAFRAAHRQDRSIRVPEVRVLGWLFDERSPDRGGSS